MLLTSPPLPAKPSHVSPLTVLSIPASGTADVLRRWAELETRMPNTALTCSRLWNEIWLRHYGDLVNHRFLIAESNGKTRGVCLLANGVDVRVGPFPVNSLHIGTAGDPDEESVCVEYNRVLIEPTFRTAFICQILRNAQNDPHWDEFHLDGFCREDAGPFLEQFPSTDIRCAASRYFDLADARREDVEVLSQLGRSTRSNLRRRLRDYGDVTLEWAESPEHAHEIFSELIDLHQARWRAVGKPGVFTSERFTGFQRDLLSAGLSKNRVVMFRVRRGADTIGCLFLLVDNNRLLDYLSGFAPFDEFESPGLVVHYLCMNEALHRGFDAYDFLAGDRRHKQNLSNAEKELLWVTWRRKRLVYLLQRSVRLAKQCLNTRKKSRPRS